MAEDALVIFTPSGRRGRFPTGTTVLDAARSLGVDIDSVCGGRGICGRCQVTQGLGEFPKHGITSEPSHLSAFAELESTYRSEKGLAADRRLSCTATVCGDVLIDVLYMRIATGVVSRTGSTAQPSRTEGASIGVAVPT